MISCVVCCDALPFNRKLKINGHNPVYGKIIIQKAQTETSY